MIKIRNVLLVLVVFFSNDSVSFNPFTILQKQISPGGDRPRLLLTEVETREEERESLLAEQEELSAAQESFFAPIKKRIETVQQEIKLVQQQLKEDPDNQFLTRKRALLNELYLMLKQLQPLWNQEVSVINEQIELLELYLSDPKMSKLGQEFFEGGPYGFDDLKDLYRLILEKRRARASAEEQKKIVAANLERGKQTVIKNGEQREKREKELENQRNGLEGSDLSKLTPEQRKELQQLEHEIADIQDKIDELYVKENEHLLALSKLKYSLSSTELRVLEDVFKEIKSRVRVGEVEISHAQEELAAKLSEHHNKKRQLGQQIDQLDADQKEARQELEELAKELGVTLGRNLNEWGDAAPKTVDGYLSLIRVGGLNTSILLLGQQKDLLKARVDADDEQIKSERTLVNVQRTFYKIKARKFETDEDIVKENKKYDQDKIDIRNRISSYNGKITTVENELKARKIAKGNLDRWFESLKQQEKVLFKMSSNVFKQCQKTLITARDSLEQDIKTLEEIKIIYGDIIIGTERTLKLVSFISDELETSGIWYRPEHAVSLDGIKNIVSDVQSFMYDLQAYVAYTSLPSIMHRFKGYFVPFRILLFILQLLLILTLFSVARTYLPKTEESFKRKSEKTLAGARTLYLACAALLGCIVENFILIMLFLLVLLVAFFYLPNDPYIYIALYLLAIPYLIYVVRRCLNYFGRFNKEYDYAFLSEKFQPRLSVVFSILVYATIAIFFFRQAFILGNYSSELPTILLTINYIIFQVALISLISKDEILGLIPRGTEFWDNVAELVDRYYYLLLLIVITIIVMSNPYVGFGRLVLYVLRRVVYTVALVVFFLWLHQQIRRLSSHFFFVSAEDITKERFVGAKTWYGVSVIVLFLVFMFFGGIFVAKIWGWPEWLSHISNWSDIRAMLKTPLGDNEYNNISLWTLATIIMYVLIGILASYGFGRFVLDKIFNLLQVDPGIQNTVSSISHYIIFIVSTILGFNAAGLSSIIVWLVGGLIVSIGLVIKDPVLDFVSYFIILVQRPIKVGDFIQLSDAMSGVVRKITPRSIVLRQKNSTSIVIPNSLIISKPIVNWNYMRGFIAFNDIVVTVAYHSDPFKAREVMQTILDQNNYVLKNPRPIVRLDDFGMDGYAFTVRGYINSAYTLDQWDIASSIRMAIVRDFDTNGIELAVPTRLLLKETSPSVKVVKQESDKDAEQE